MITSSLSKNYKFLIKMTNKNVRSSPNRFDHKIKILKEATLSHIKHLLYNSYQKNKVKKKVRCRGKIKSISSWEYTKMTEALFSNCMNTAFNVKTILKICSSTINNNFSLKRKKMSHNTTSFSHKIWIRNLRNSKMRNSFWILNMFFSKSIHFANNLKKLRWKYVLLACALLIKMRKNSWLIST